MMARRRVRIMEEREPGSPLFTGLLLSSVLATALLGLGAMGLVLLMVALNHFPPRRTAYAFLGYLLAWAFTSLIVQFLANRNLLRRRGIEEALAVRLSRNLALSFTLPFFALGLAFLMF